MSIKFSDFENLFKGTEDPEQQELEKKRREALNTAKAFFQKMAKEKSPVNSSFSDREGQEWLMEQLDELLELDGWSNDDAATLTALFYFLVTQGE